jgi:hypothetical protein
MAARDADTEYGASFTAAVPGAFYSGELKYLEGERRIRPLEIDKSIPVDTAWDLTMGIFMKTPATDLQVYRGAISNFVNSSDITSHR